ncbi:cyclin-dependent protein serine/threonine kinase [Aureococcus anophagefferens]|nr:cyclin-dependent protein serine/threonine kinase [Aureococcus anophagefferens]
MRPLRALLVLAAVAGAARRRGKTCVLTISCLNNFAHVLSFFEAARSANPQIDCWAWAIADRPEFYAGASPLLTAEARDAVAALRRALPAYATAVTLDDLQAVADFPLLELAFKYGLVEFNTAIKAHAVTYAFDVLGGAKCLYFDNDVWVLRSLWEIEALLDAASTDTRIGQAGIFNFGFVAFRDAPGARSRGGRSGSGGADARAARVSDAGARGGGARRSRYRAVPYGYAFFDGGACVVAAARDAYRGATDPDGDAARRRLFARTVRLDNPFNGTPPVLRAAGDGARISVAQWLFEGPYDLPFDLVGAAYVPELAWHAYRSRDGPEAGRPGGRVAATDAAAAAALLAAEPARVWTWFLAYLGDAPGLRKVATAMLRAHRADADPPAFGVSLAGCLDGEDALLAALCDARVPHAAFDACGRLAPPPGPRVPPFAVTLVAGAAAPRSPGPRPRRLARGRGARRRGRGALDGRGAAGRLRRLRGALRRRPAAAAAAAFPRPFLRCRRRALPRPAPPFRAWGLGLAVVALASALARQGRDPPLDARGAAGDGDGDAAAGSDTDDATLVVDSDTEDDEEAPPAAQDAVLLLESKTPKKRK